MSHTSGVRQAQKQRTRQALLDAGLRLLAEQSLSSLGLREVTREVGVAPAAFYRHFRDIPDLGVALVQESFGSLHTAIRAILAEQDETGGRIDSAVDAIVRYVGGHRPHMRFIARERYGGVRAVREAIAAELGRFTEEVAGSLSPRPVYEGWTADDMRMLAELFVDHMVTTAAALLDAGPDARAAQERIAATARRQLRLISVGCRHWRSG
ncbi:TetR family transcriptional regulator [Streptomyces sp. NPDC048639]|uniref:TetR family transcriptional regulator n=1 Tax=Streptomyces sp. NPDC048639 TaxID=3365581 RepID=UPI003718ADE1